MTTATSTSPTAGMPVRPAPAASAGGHGAPVPVATIDPIKLALKYQWWLMGALFGGLMMGAVLHFAIGAVYPFWQAKVTYQCYIAESDISKLSGSQTIDEATLDRFMQTQAKLITSDVVLRRVAEDPRLVTEAPRWSKYYMERDGSFNTSEALLDLQDEVSARALANTQLIEVSMVYRDKRDVTAIIRLVREAFSVVVRDRTDSTAREQRDAIIKSIADYTDKIRELQTRRERIIQENKVDIVQKQQMPEVAEKLRQINQELVRLRLDLEAYTLRLKVLESEQQKPGGIEYAAQLRDEVEAEPLVLNLKQLINQLESDLKALRIRFTDEHRAVKEVERQLEGYKQRIQAERETLLRQRFDAQVDSVRKFVDQLRAQELDLTTRYEDGKQQMTQLNRIQAQLDDIEEQVRQLITSRSEMEKSLAQIIAVTGLEQNKRVVVAIPEREPTEPLFPKIKVMVPAGGIIAFGLMLGILVLRELVDQRVKGPSDVAIIPKARVLGMVPDAAEDPAGAGTVESAFRDRERGVMAESFRQIRAAMLKRVQQAGHRTILVCAGMPGSGATSVVSNLAYAFSASDRRVLVIDANLRRPAQHRIFGLPDHPGLADVLSGAQTLESAVQRSADRRVDVLTAGTREVRVFERLSTEGMGAILREAREKYDLVLIDCAPLVVSGDGLGLATRCDASILVVRAMAEKRGMVARLRNELAEARAELLGVLVNGVKSSAGGYFKRNIKATHEYQTKDAA